MIKKSLLVCGLLFLNTTISFAANDCLATLSKHIKRSDVVELYLQDCGIQDKDLPTLVFQLNKLPSHIDMLSLGSNNIHDKGAIILAEIKTIPILALSYNKIGDKGAIALSKNIYFKKIWLDHNKIGDTGALAFARNKNLTALGLENNLLTQQGKNALMKNKAIEDLRL